MNYHPTGYPKGARNWHQEKIDRLESTLDDYADAKWELEYMEARCMNAVRDELLSLAREVEISGGNPGVQQAIDYAFDLISDVAFDGHAKLSEQAEAVSLSLDGEYRRQGVA